MKIDRKDAEEMIYKTKGRFFGATFIKKDGTLRTMNCRLKVKKYLKGGTLKFNPSEKGLVPVCDMAIKEYRMININTLQSLRIARKEYNVA